MFTPHGAFSPVQLIPLLLIVPLLVFWAWMFQEMRGNRELPESAKNDWTLAFILLNVFAAVLYYVNVYKQRH
jgi:hypothetical protein